MSSENDRRDNSERGTLKDRFEVCLQNRNFEIELVWKRSQFFWVVNAAALAGFAAVKPEATDTRFLVICFGFLSSFCWLLINIGSKWWQEAWEEKLKCTSSEYFDREFLEKYKVGQKNVFLLPLVQISVTGVVTAFSLFLCLVWFAIGGWYLWLSLRMDASFIISVDVRYLLAANFCFIFCVLIFFGTFRRKCSSCENSAKASLSGNS